jgi:peptide/nickel transport system substrate-binding protein
MGLDGGVGGDTTRRGLLTRAAAGAVAVVGAGSGPAVSAVLAAPAAQTARGITLTMSQEPPTLGYGIGNAYVNTVTKFLLGSEPGLTRRNDRNDWVPYLAESTPTIDNGGAVYVGEGADQSLQVTFTMRQDVRWSDGTPVTAHDVVFAWELQMHPDYPVPTRTTMQKVASISAPDDYTVVVRFMNQNEARDAAANGYRGIPASAFADLASQQGPVLDPNYNHGIDGYAIAFPRHVLQPIIDRVGVAALPQQDINRSPLGVGPFRLREWLPGQRIVTEAVPGYFQGDPRLSSVVVRVTSDTNALIAQLSTGEADGVTEDALTEFNSPDLDRLERERRIQAFYTPGATWEHVDLNLDNFHLKDVRVRKAIWHAINRQAMVDRVLNGKTQVIHTWAPSWRWDSNPDVPKYDFNLQKARDLLREAGYSAGRDGVLVKDGQRLSLRYVTTAGNQMRLLTSQIAQATLKEVGIDIQLQYIPAAELFAAGDNPGPLWGRTFEMAQYAWVGGDDPVGAKNLFASGGIPSRENSYVGQNFPGFRDARNDQLLFDAENTLDQETRRGLYFEQQRLWVENAPTITLFARANTTAIKRGMENWRPAPTNTPPSWNAHDWNLAI